MFFPSSMNVFLSFEKKRCAGDEHDVHSSFHHRSRLKVLVMKSQSQPVFSHIFLYIVVY